MAAFSHAHQADIEANIAEMYRRLSAVSLLKLSHNQFLQLFVPASRRELFKEVAPAAAPGRTHFYYSWPNGVRIAVNVFDTNASFAPPLPRHPILEHDAPQELVSRISGWIERGGDASVDVGRVLQLFGILNQKCTRSQIRFIWPSILSIMSISERPGLKPLIQALQDVKTPKETPALPAGVLRACRRTSETVAMCSLLPSELSSITDAEVVLQVMPGRAVTEDGLGTFKGLG